MKRPKRPKGLTAAKARTILHDKEARGYKLTGKQRRFFGAVAGGAKPRSPKYRVR